MKTVALVTAHFPPSNLAGVHRARIWSQYLPEFGWKPIVVTTHWDYYEEALDWGLMELIDPSLEVIRTKAFRTKPVRLIGNLALRSLYWTYKALDDLWRSKRLDFVHLIVPDHFTALLGPMLFRKHKLPYGIDYVDPWVHARPSEKVFLSKAWVSCCLSYVLEPLCVKNANLITGVAESYFVDVFDRNPDLAIGAITSAMPMANSEKDFDLVGSYTPEVNLFRDSKNCFEIVYAGALLPKAHSVLYRFFEGVRELFSANSTLPPIHFTFIGTGRSPTDNKGYQVKPMAQKCGIEEHVSEHPTRISYLDVLWHLRKASAILILGSTEQHYTPSKVFQALQSGTRILALLRSESDASALLRDSERHTLIEMSQGTLPTVTQIKQALDALARGLAVSESTGKHQEIPIAARETTRKLAIALDRAVTSRR